MEQPRSPIIRPPRPPFWDGISVAGLELSVGPADLPAFWASHVISLHECDESCPPWVQKRLKADPSRSLRVLFSDVSERHAEHPNHIPPTLGLLKELACWGAALPPGSALHVHCAAGMSRSVAVALAVVCERAQGLTHGELMALAQQLNPHGLPNRHLLDLLDAGWDRSLRLDPWWHSRMDGFDLDRLFG